MYLVKINFLFKLKVYLNYDKSSFFLFILKIILDNRGPWYDVGNVNNRINDGVVAISLAGSDRNPTYRRRVC